MISRISKLYIYDHHTTKTSNEEFPMIYLLFFFISCAPMINAMEQDPNNNASCKESNNNEITEIFKKNNRLGCLLAINEDNTDLLKDLLLQYNESEATEAKKSFLLHAAQYNHPSSCQMLLDQGVSVNTTDAMDCCFRGYTALHYAAFYGHKDVVELLLKHKADATLRCTNQGDTPLHCAVKESALVLPQLRTNYINCFKLLLAHNSSLAHIPNNENKTPLQIGKA